MDLNEISIKKYEGKGGCYLLLVNTKPEYCVFKLGYRKDLFDWL